MSPHRETALDAAAIVKVLNRHCVDYIVIGAFAAIAQRAPIPASRDIDLTPDTTVENLNRLSAALGGGTVWNLICPHGEFDISFRPSGFEEGFSQLALRAHKVSVGGVQVMIADLKDVIRSKEAAGRPKDLQVLPTLYRHQRSFESDEAVLL